MKWDSNVPWLQAQGLNRSCLADWFAAVTDNLFHLLHMWVEPENVLSSHLKYAIDSPAFPTNHQPTKIIIINKN